MKQNEIKEEEEEEKEWINQAAVRVEREKV